MRPHVHLLADKTTDAPGEYMVHVTDRSFFVTRMATTQWAASPFGATQYHLLHEEQAAVGILGPYKHFKTCILWSNTLKKVKGPSTGYLINKLLTFSHCVSYI